MKTLRLLMVALIASTITLVSCGGGSGAAKNDTPGQVVEKSYKLLQDKEYEKAAAMFCNKGKMLTEEEAEKIEGMMAWATTEHQKKDGIKEVIIIEETLVGDEQTAKVKYNIVFNNGDEDDRKQALTKIDGKWYLDVVTK
jgi:ABC-type glycerol-3-phosphate transport system substrate-binding protein